jgi:phosphohistidine phosphatase SixA
MRLYMFSGLLAIMSGAGLLGFTLPSNDVGVNSPQVLLIHHATADEGADVADVRFGDCTTQRNLSEAGRREAENMGARLSEHHFMVQRVLVSPFCRTAETARLMKLRPIEYSAAFLTLTGDGKDPLSAARVEAARMLINSWRGPGVLVVVTHGSIIKALTGAEPQPGKFIVYHPSTDNRAGAQQAGARFEMMMF